MVVSREWFRERSKERSGACLKYDLDRLPGCLFRELIDRSTTEKQTLQRISGESSEIACAKGHDLKFGLISRPYGGPREGAGGRAAWYEA